MPGQFDTSPSADLRDAAAVRADSTRWLDLLLPCVACFFVYWQAWVSDDAYITFRHVDNTLGGFGLGFNPGERVQAFTHPLWFLTLLAGGCLFDLHALAVALGLVLTAITFLVLARSLRHRAQATLRLLIAAGILLSSTTFVEFQTSGLETSLTTLLLTILGGGLLTRAVPRAGAVFVSGLLVLTRPDHVLLVAPLCILVFARDSRRRHWRRLVLGAAALLPVAAWYLFATIYYGTPVPNTAYAKLAFAPSEAMLQGSYYLLDYLEHEPVHAIIILAALAGGIVQGVQRIRRGDQSGWFLLCLSCGICLHILYILRIGGDFMRGRFLLPALVGAVLVGCEIIGPAVATSQAWRRFACILVVAIPLWGLLRIREYLPVGPMTGFRSLIEQEWSLWVLVVSGSALVLLATVFLGVRSLRRGGLQDGGVALISVLLSWLCVLAMAGYRELHWGVALVLVAALAGSLALTLKLAFGGEDWARLCAPAVLLLAAIGSLCETRPRSGMLLQSRGVARESAGYNTRWFESRFRRPSEYPHYIMEEWIETGWAARRYAEQFGSITVMNEALGLCAWEAGPRVHVIDSFGLADAFLARSPAVQGSRVGHIEHVAPEGYLQQRGLLNLLPGWRARMARLDPSLRSEAERMKSQARWDDLRELRRWQRTQLIISGELFSPERLRTIPAYIADD